MRRVPDISTRFSELAALDEPTGPRGGTTTRTPSGMIKKNFWLSTDLAEELRQRAFEERRTESAIIREGLVTALRRDEGSGGGKV